MGLSVHLDLAMKFLALALIVASASAKNLRFNLLAPPTELEYGFCDGSPEPLTFDVMSVTPFPILVQNGALPLGPGVYGGGDPLTVGPIESIPDILLPFLKGTVRAEATVTDGSGNLFGCIYV